MSYVDAGYCIALTVLFLYAVSLVVRRRRLERAAALAEPPGVGVGTHASEEGGVGAPPGVTAVGVGAPPGLERTPPAVASEPVDGSSPPGAG